MRHGMPPIIRMQSMLGIEPSLSVDVECTLTADFFTQMRVGDEPAAHGREPDDPRQPEGNQNLPDPRNWELPQPRYSPGQFPIGRHCPTAYRPR